MTPIEDVKKNLHAQVNLGRSFMNASVEGDALDALAAIESLESDNARLREALASLAPLLRHRPDGDYGWRGNPNGKCGFITVSDILLVERAAEALNGAADTRYCKHEELAKNPHASVPRTCPTCKLHKCVKGLEHPSAAELAGKEGA